MTFATRWQSLGCTPSRLSLIKFGYALPLLSRPPLTRSPTVFSGYKDKDRDSALDTCVQDLLAKRAIDLVLNPRSLGFYSRLFLVPKPGKRWRPVIDLSHLNHFLDIRTFKMETPESIRASLQIGEWVTSIDLQDAYFHIPIHCLYQKYLRFTHKGRVYQFRALPFGLATAPLIFTMVAKEVKLMALARGIRLHAYLDDWLIRAESPDQARLFTSQMIQLIQDLGWVINQKKSELQPTQIFDFVGYQYDLRLGLVRPTQERWSKLTALISALNQRSVLTARELMSLIGLLASTEKLVPQGRLHMRPLQWHLKKFWNFKESLDKKIPWDNQMKSHLLWWSDPQNVLKGSDLHPKDHDILLFTDASNEGWGCQLGDHSAKGFWSPMEKKLHINVLELKAVVLALKHFRNLCSNRTVLVATDNSSVVAYINKQGGTHSVQMCALLWHLLTWCNRHQILLQARHIPGCLNVLADALSRSRQIQSTEWSLHPQVVKSLCTKWFQPHVDLFATRHNHKLPVYVSPVPDPQAWAVDALHMNWSGLLAYAYPPTALIPQVINKVHQCTCQLILIAPGWPGMPWFWDLIHLSLDVPIRLPVFPRLLKQPLSPVFHNRPEHLNLHAWLVGVRPSNSKGSLKRWQLELLHLKDHQPEQSINQSGPFFNNGVRTTQWTSPVSL